MCSNFARFYKQIAALLIVATVLVLPTPSPASAQSTGDDAQDLVDRYSPVFMLKEQTAACDTEGEAFAPMPVEVVLENRDVLLRQAGEGDPIVGRAPSAEDLAGRGPGFFLDFNGLALAADCVYERDFDVYTEDLPSVVYARVATQEDAPGMLAVQYWSYWYYNDWNNKHESDWEFTQVLFEADSVAEALESEPVSVGFAQHEGGERALWDDDKLQRDGDHPVVYASAGSHASYYASSHYLGRGAAEGFGCDSTDGPSREVRPLAVLLPDDDQRDQAPEFAWLDYEGRWGERQSGPFNGPTGPTTKPRWDRPIDWAEELRDDSVSLPITSLQPDSVVRRFCSVVAAGSNQLRLLQVSPERTLIGLGALFVVGRFLAARTNWSSAEAAPLVRRRRLGQILRISGKSLWTSRGRLLISTGFYIAGAAVLALVGVASSLATQQTTLTILTPLLYVAAAIAAALYWSAASEADRPGAGETVREVLRRYLSIWLTMALSTVIVAALALTVIGLPFALRQLVRYQFAVPVATVERLSGFAALRRSQELVDGRWFHTAVTMGVANGLLAGLGLLVGMIMLVVFAGWPLWLLIAAAFAALGLVVPVVVSVLVLIYGDAVAEQDQDRSSLGVSTV